MRIALRPIRYFRILACEAVSSSLALFQQCTFFGSARTHPEARVEKNFDETFSTSRNSHGMRCRVCVFQLKVKRT